MERTMRLAIAVLALSFLLLLFIDREIPDASPTISPSCGGEDVRISGTVMEVDSREIVTRIRLLPFENPITVVAFPRKVLNMSAGDVLRIEGRWQEYGGRLEIIADSIERRG